MAPRLWSMHSAGEGGVFHMGALGSMRLHLRDGAWDSLLRSRMAWR